MRIAAARAHVNVPRRCVWMTRSKSSSLIFHRTRSRRTPAFVTIRSRRSYSPTARATSASAVAVSPTGAISATARPPAPVISGDRLVGRVRVDVVDHDGRARGGERDGVRTTEAAAAAGDDGDLAVQADRAHVKNRNRHSATSAGFGASLTSIWNVAFACTPPLTSDTSVRTPLPRNCAPTGSGAGKRTLSVP